MTKMQMRKLMNLCEGIDNKPISEAEEWKEAYMDIARYVKNVLVSEVQKNGEVIDQHTELLKEQAQFLMEIGETLEQFRDQLEQIEARGNVVNADEPGRIH